MPEKPMTPTPMSGAVTMDTTRVESPGGSPGCCGGELSAMCPRVSPVASAILFPTRDFK